MSLSPDPRSLAAALPAPVAAELTVVSPTFNERANVAPLVAKLEAALEGVRWEVLFVDDDSPDGTIEAVKELAQVDPRVRGLRRVGRRGLAGAVIEGALASAAPFVAVIDADMQHDETLLPRMLERLRAGDVELVVGSRYLETAGPDDGLSPFRKLGSQLATALARQALGVEVTDPMAGFFMIRRETIERVAPRLSPAGFKVLFDIIATHPKPLGVAELPYSFKDRTAGESKMDARVVVEYLGLLAAKMTGDIVPPRLVFFALIGGGGLLAQALALAAIVGLAPTVPLAQAAGAAAAVGAVVTFFVANGLAYRARRRKGWRLTSGFLQFAAAAAFGVAGDVAIALALASNGVPPLSAALAGALCGAVWNYAVALAMF